MRTSDGHESDLFQTGRGPFPSGAWARRTPLLLLRSSGVFLFRFAELAFSAVLFPLPPRSTRFEPVIAKSLHSSPH